MSNRDDFWQREADDRNSKLFNMGATPYEDFEPWTAQDIYEEWADQMLQREIDAREDYYEQVADLYYASI